MTKKFLLVMFCLISTKTFAGEYSFSCEKVGDMVQRCVNSEVVCYVYDTKHSLMKGGRGAGLSCFKK